MGRVMSSNRVIDNRKTRRVRQRMTHPNIIINYTCKTNKQDPWHETKGYETHIIHIQPRNELLIIE